MSARASGSPDRLTKQKIIDSALALYAEHGIDGVPVRVLTSHAGVNIASIHYHFGGTEALAEAVFSELSARVNKQRTLALQEIVEGAQCVGHKADVTNIVSAFVEPYVGEGSSTEGLLLAQLILKHRLSPSPMTERVIKKHFDPMAKQFVAALHEAVPDVPLALMYGRYMFMVSTVVLSMSDRSRGSRLRRLLGSRTSATYADADAIRSDLIDFIVGGMMARPSRQAS